MALLQLLIIVVIKKLQILFFISLQYLMKVFQIRVIRIKI